MLNRSMLCLAVGAMALPLSAQERRPTRERYPQPRVYINGEEVNPMDMVTNRRARIGVSVDTRAVENDSIGATISTVTPGGPAAKAGIRSGDIITRLNGQRLIKSASDRSDDEDASLAAVRLLEMVAKLEPGDTVAVEYRRGRETRTASVITAAENTLARRDLGDGNVFFRIPGTEGNLRELEGNFRGLDGLGELRVTRPRVGAMPEGSSSFGFSFGGPFADLELAPVNADLGAYFGTTEGVLVIDAPERNSLGLKGGDVILSVDGRKARGPSSLLRIMSSYETGDVMKLEILRNKGRQTISSKVDRDDE